ncbi:MAG: indole-3-glycerol phosphate synthase TrpC [Chloroflexi bacterium]|nr:indole-3-glycerol phosphate synthase TrpC [Chloroflexota bacterium]
MTGIPDILTKIVDVKRREVERAKMDVPLAELECRIADLPVPLNLSGALMGDRVRIIAECKKASPAKGLLRADYDAGALARAYVDNGAAAISCLTNVDHFQGSLDDLRAVADVAHARGVPVLRKEFIFDPYQIAEARANGADAILLIVAMLPPKQLRDLRELAQKYWLQCLVEVHTADEMQIALDAGAEIVGINNRDLHTFKTDLATTERLAKMVPFGSIVVSESGIHTPADIQRVRVAGAHAALIGESLVVAPDPGAKLREFV